MNKNIDKLTQVKNHTWRSLYFSFTTEKDKGLFEPFYGKKSEKVHIKNSPEAQYNFESFAFKACQIMNFTTKIIRIEGFMISRQTFEQILSN
mmetsp:Transcript_10862/g.9584  ORF Transcript_10862/g.9584 Transcript_10862/m.9584 type:complete len:92 (+) Transcript_10862:94-369(+)